MKFNVEEYHRGEWQPLMVKSKEGGKQQKVVKISQEDADSMNKYSSEYRIRYVKADETAKAKSKDEKSDDVKELRAEYEAKFDKKPFAGWDAKKLKEKINEKK